MLGVKRRGAIQLRSAEGGANFVGVACFVVCISFSVLSSLASAETVGVHGVVGANSNNKTTLIKKPDAACDAPSPSKNSRSCLVSLSATDKLRAQKGFSFVDVRSPAEFDRYRIAGSINIPLHLVKTKEFLKKLPVVLVNDGRSTTELEKTCAELKQIGFERVSILDGGLFAWYTNKRALEGDPVAQSKLNRMSAEELFESRSSSSWSVIDVSTQKKDKEIISWLPAKVIAIPFKSKLKGDSISRISAAVLQQHKKNPQGKLLLIADDNDVYEQIDAKLKKSGVTSGVLRLDGGIKGYREHVKNQQAIWSQQNQQNQPRRYQACRG